MLIAEQPTRGVDVGAIEFIHGQLVAERDKGRAVLLVSAELSEILALSDRILVMYEGRILADMPRAQASEETLGLLMAGRARRPRERLAASAVARLRPPPALVAIAVRRRRRRRAGSASRAPIRSQAYARYRRRRTCA